LTSKSVSAPFLSSFEIAYSYPSVIRGYPDIRYPCTRLLAQPDGDKLCSFGAINLSVTDHSDYFGKNMSKFGIDGCPNLACEADSSKLKAQIQAQRLKSKDR
jgi:hypothetical protein